MPLYLDLFVEVLARVEDNTDLWHVSQACHALNRLATDEILRRHVALSHSKQLAPFLQFVAKDAGRRGALVRDLSICIAKPNSTAIDIIINILSHCRWIRTFAIGLVILADDRRRIGNAICALEELRVLDVGTATQQAFVTWHTRRRTASKVQDTPRDDARDSDDDEFLYRLGLQSPILYDIPLVFTSQDAACCPNVTTLDLSLCRVENAILLARAFPNVRHLLLQDACVQHVGLLTGTSQEIGVMPWKQLDYLESSLEVFRELSISCPVRHWNISDTIHAYDPNELERLLEIITEASITRLTMDLDLDAESPEDIEQLMSIGDRSSLTHLSLRIDVWNLVSDDAETLPNRVLEFACLCQLVYLELHMLGYPWPEQVSYPDMDPDYVASSFFTKVPSLRYLSLSLSDENHTDYWVAGTPSESPGSRAKQVSKGEFGRCRVTEGMDTSRYSLAVAR